MFHHITSRCYSAPCVEEGLQLLSINPPFLSTGMFVLLGGATRLHFAFSAWLYSLSDSALSHHTYNTPRVSCLCTVEVLLVTSLRVPWFGWLSFFKTTESIISIMILFFLFPVAFVCLQFGVANGGRLFPSIPRTSGCLSSASVPQAMLVTLIRLVPSG